MNKPLPLFSSPRYSYDRPWVYFTDVTPTSIFAFHSCYSASTSSSSSSYSCSSASSSSSSYVLYCAGLLLLLFYHDELSSTRVQHQKWWKEWWDLLPNYNGCPMAWPVIVITDVEYDLVLELIQYSTIYFCFGYESCYYHWLWNHIQYYDDDDDDDGNESE